MAESPSQTKALADQRWLQLACQHGSAYWVRNSNARYQQYDLAECHLALAQSSKSQSPLSYVQCPRSAWIDYPLNESARHLQGFDLKLAQLAGTALAPALRQLLHSTGLLQSITLANQLISTNLYPFHFAGQIAQLSQHLSKREQAPLLIRNICAEVNPPLTQALIENGWDMLPSRLIYLSQPELASIWQHNHVKQDAKLISSSRLQHDQLQFIPATELPIEDMPRLSNLYQQLFIQKHSGLNPNFSLKFFEFCRATDFLELYALKQGPKYLGVIGLYSRPESHWLTTPLLGYALDAPPHLAIYRRLMAFLLQQAKERNLHLHYSSGAGSFKRLRGAYPVMEYCAVYSAHLPLYKRLAMQTWANLLKRAVPRILAKSLA